MANAMAARRCGITRKGNNIVGNEIKQTEERRERQWKLNIKAKEQNYWENKFRGKI